MGLLKDSVEDFAFSHYHSMPGPIRDMIMEEGKKKMEAEDPNFCSFISESTKEKIVENYFSKKEMERCQKR